MKDCPKCNSMVEGMVCGVCGFAEPGYGRTDLQRTDQLVSAARSAAMHYAMPHRTAIEQAAVDKFPSNDRPGKWWAQRIVYRHEQGEHVGSLALSSAYEALGIVQSHQQQEKENVHPGATLYDEVGIHEGAGDSAE